MLKWLFQHLRPPQHEPDVQKAQAEQKRRFADWEQQLREVARVEKIAQLRHRDLHKPR